MLLGMASFQKQVLCPGLDSDVIRERAIEQGATLEDFYQKIICQAVVEIKEWYLASIRTSFQCAFLYYKGWKSDDVIFQIPLQLGFQMCSDFSQACTLKWDSGSRSEVGAIFPQLLQTATVMELCVGAEGGKGYHWLCVC